MAKQQLLAISDLHVEVPENRQFVANLRPDSRDDWLVICGDVGEVMSDIEWGLCQLASNFAQVIWAPGNHELWTRPDDPVQLRGDERYRHLVRLCQELGVITPEDLFPIWNGPGGQVVIAPLFLLYDYSFRACQEQSKKESLARARAAGIVCSDELLLITDPYPSIEEWCMARVELSRAKLTSLGEAPVVLVNHFPLLRELTNPLYYPEFAQWCGTRLTAGWHKEFHAIGAIYGHLHIPRTTWHDGVRFEEVSLGYPREWSRRGPPSVRRILPEENDTRD